MKKNCRKLERKFLKQLKQYTLNHLHQGRLLHFVKVVRVLEKVEM